jgi:hypothetical protein
MGWEVIVICVVLMILVFLVFGQTLGHGFVHYDDDTYVYENPIVLKGLSFEGLRWAFTYGEIGHWHPLTWVTHMLDCQFFGLWAGGHHLDNVILHAVAVVMLFLVLFQMTGAVWRCGFVAAVWAVHPLRVESVAWVAERKDVLAAVFFMLTLGAYIRYIRQPSILRYVLLAVSFTLGLLSKNMLVTLPFVLLLMDYWPLGRLDQGARFPRLLQEKIPLFVLSAFSCTITFLVPEKLSAAVHLPFSLRIQNALVSTCIYLRQTLWPTDLVAHYPNPTHAFPFWEVAGSLVLLCFISVAAFLLRKSHAYLLVGWLWFIGMLVPVIGLMQISTYSHADRYTYLPQIGLFVGAIWAVSDWVGAWRYRRFAFAGVAVVVLWVLLIAARQQTSYWRDNKTLWTHTLECTRDNYLPQYNLGLILHQEGRLDEAIAHYREALRINPDYPQAHTNLGLALIQQGQIEEAIVHAQKALEILPDDVNYQNNLALLLAAAPQPSLRNGARALELARKANLASGGNDPAILRTLALAYAETGEFSEAVQTARKALDLAVARSNTGLAEVLRHEIELYAAGRRL